MGAVAVLLAPESEWARRLWGDWHHVVGHNLGFSPIEIVSARADAAVVAALHRRFPRTLGATSIQPPKNTEHTENNLG